MKTLCFLYILSMSLVTIAQQQTANITNQQTLTWTGKAAVGGYSPEGTLEIASAAIEFTSEEIKALTIVVDMKTLEQENQQLRDHLREEDFFFVKKYPLATFYLLEPAPLINGEAKLYGKMTIRGKTQTESIPAVVKISEGDISISFDHKMDRTRYGVNHNSPSIFKRLKENAIADEFVLRGRLVFQN